MPVTNGILALVDVIIWLICIGTWRSATRHTLRAYNPIFAKKFLAFFENISYLMLFFNIMLYIIYTHFSSLTIFTVIFYACLGYLIFFITKAFLVKIKPQDHKIFKKDWLNYLITDNVVVYLFVFLLINYTSYFIRSIM
jgi:hypothetical protein